MRRRGKLQFKVSGMAALFSIGVAFGVHAQTDSGQDRIVERATLTGVVVEILPAGKPLPKQNSPQDMTLMLIDGADGAERGGLGDNTTIDRATLTEKSQGTFSVRADLPGKGVQSVRFFIDDSPAGLDRTAPFMLFGDAADTRAGFNRQQVPQKAFKIRAVAYAGANGDGIVVSDKSVFVQVK